MSEIFATIQYIDHPARYDVTVPAQSNVTSKDHLPLGRSAVVSAGGRLTINASPPGWTLRSVAEREQFGCDQG